MNNRTYLIVGGTGGIGRAMIQQLVNGTASDNDNNNNNNNNNNKTDNSGKQDIHVFATYHRNIPDFEADNLHWVPMNICEEQSIEQAAKVIQQNTPHIDWIINCVGLLHTATQQPEKALRQVDTEFFLQNMQVNALASLLIAKHFRPLLAKSARSNDKPAVFATISARVGSISDNQLGGWYSYRMSKAALNMGMKNLSIEWNRSLKNVCVVVMQPGTVNTQLSAPFQGNVAEGQLFSPAYSAECLLEVLNRMTAAQSGSFVDWAGESIPW